jgi:GNAT superfamily N-acetyltransferase
MSNALPIREARREDSAQIVELLRAALGWTDDPRFDAFFDWKHYSNPFGESAAWIALDADRVVGFRAMLRWEFEREGDTVRAARPVDTATHPLYRRRGLFRSMTNRALESLHSDGVDLIFNTPNRTSGAGYLQMGWQSLGRLSIRVRPTRPWRGLRMIGRRVAADRWAAETRAGVPAVDVLRDGAGLRELLSHRQRPPGLRTRLTPSFLSWRYGEPLLGYRALPAAGGLGEGVAFFRIRQRGRGRELVLCEVLVHERAGAGAASALVRHVLRAAADEADYAIQMAGPTSADSGHWWPLPRQGPLLAARTLVGAEPPRREEWALTLGDIELL